MIDEFIGVKDGEVVIMAERMPTEWRLQENISDKRERVRENRFHEESKGESRQDTWWSHF